MSGGRKNDQKSFFQENWLRMLLTLTMIVIIGIMGYLIATPPTQPAGASAVREAGLEAIVMTAASILASFLITKIYAETSYNQSLRDHGVQIASGIMVLKRQIQNLSDWINAKRERSMQGTTVDTTPELTDSVLEHIQETLLGFHGMTDVALGGIAGVIGDALAEYESVMDQIAGIRLEAREKTTEIQREIQSASSTAEVAELQMQMEEIAARTDRKIAALARTTALPIPEPSTRKVFTTQCPYCRHPNSFEMIDRVGETPTHPM